jgi:hypothetical protein
MYRADNLRSLGLLVERVRNLDVKKSRWFVLNLLQSGLFRDPALEILKEMLPERADFILEFESKVVEKMTSAGIQTFILDACIHIVKGEDQTPGSNAVGGFNQVELNNFVMLLESAETIH